MMKPTRPTPLDALDRIRNDDNNEAHGWLYDAIEAWQKGKLNQMEFCERIEQILDDEAYAMPDVEGPSNYYHLDCLVNS